MVVAVFERLIDLYGLELRSRRIAKAEIGFAAGLKEIPVFSGYHQFRPGHSL